MEKVTRGLCGVCCCGRCSSSPNSGDGSCGAIVSAGGETSSNRAAAVGHAGSTRLTNDECDACEVALQSLSNDFENTTRSASNTYFVSSHGSASDTPATAAVVTAAAASKTGVRFASDENLWRCVDCSKNAPQHNLPRAVCSQMSAKLPPRGSTPVTLVSCNNHHTQTSGTSMSSLPTLATSRLQPSQNDMVANDGVPENYQSSSVIHKEPQPRGLAMSDTEMWATKSFTSWQLVERTPGLLEQLANSIVDIDGLACALVDADLLKPADQLSFVTGSHYSGMDNVDFATVDWPACNTPLFIQDSNSSPSPFTESRAEQEHYHFLGHGVKSANHVVQADTLNSPEATTMIPSTTNFIVARAIPVRRLQWLLSKISRHDDESFRRFKRVLIESGEYETVELLCNVTKPVVSVSEAEEAQCTLLPNPSIVSKKAELQKPRITCAPSLPLLPKTTSKGVFSSLVENSQGTSVTLASRAVISAAGSCAICVASDKHELHQTRSSSQRVVQLQGNLCAQENAVQSAAISRPNSFIDCNLCKDPTSSNAATAPPNTLKKISGQINFQLQSMNQDQENSLLQSSKELKSITVIGGITKTKKISLAKQHFDDLLHKAAYSDEGAFESFINELEARGLNESLESIVRAAHEHLQANNINEQHTTMSIASRPPASVCRVEQPVNDVSIHNPTFVSVGLVPESRKSVAADDADDVFHGTPFTDSHSSTSWVSDSSTAPPAYAGATTDARSAVLFTSPSATKTWYQQPSESVKRINLFSVQMNRPRISFDSSCDHSPLFAAPHVTANDSADAYVFETHTSALKKTKGCSIVTGWPGKHRSRSFEEVDANTVSRCDSGEDNHNRLRSAPNLGDNSLELGARFSQSNVAGGGSNVMPEPEAESRPYVPERSSLLRLDEAPVSRQSLPLCGGSIGSIEEVEVRPAKRAVPPDDHVYRMLSRPRGLCIIFNNCRFPSVPDKDRPGSELDELRMRRLFEAFGFSVVCHSNQPSFQMFRLLEKYAEGETLPTCSGHLPMAPGSSVTSLISHATTSLAGQLMSVSSTLLSEGDDDMLTEPLNRISSRHDAFVCIIMTHGERHHVYGSDWTPVKLGDIFELFNNTNCAALRERPKLFFIQACRGERPDNGAPACDDSNIDNYEFTGDDCAGLAGHVHGGYSRLISRLRRLPQTHGEGDEHELRHCANHQRYETDAIEPSKPSCDWRILQRSNQPSHTNRDASGSEPEVERNELEFPERLFGCQNDVECVQSDAGLIGRLIGGGSRSANGTARLDTQGGDNETSTAARVPLSSLQQRGVSATTSDQASSHVARRIPSWSDMYIAYAVTEGYESLRDLRTGSWFMKAVFDVMARHAHDTDLDSLMECVCRRVLEKSRHDGQRQCPEIRKIGWRKKLYFNPGFSFVRPSLLLPPPGIPCSSFMPTAAPYVAEMT